MKVILTRILWIGVNGPDGRCILDSFISKKTKYSRPRSLYLPQEEADGLVTALTEGCPACPLGILVPSLVGVGKSPPPCCDVYGGTAKDTGNSSKVSMTTQPYGWQIIGDRKVECCVVQTLFPSDS